MSHISTEAAPRTFGPYSTSVRRGNLVFTSGVVGYDEDRTIDPDFASQVRRAFVNLEASLKASGAAVGDVVTVNAFLANSADTDEFNTLYAEFFVKPYPARTTVVAGLKEGVLFEINAQAVVPD